ncbi:MAG: helix-turn-helix domain-containing protein [Anaerolineaceae bacterium]|nr:helix-turn-helix domain-containing protein [Anaerolineaceae bacterium]
MKSSFRWTFALIPYPDLGYGSRLVRILRVDNNTFNDHRQALQAILRAARAEARLRQADLAARLGRPQSFVSKYESGERRLDLIDLQAICNALKFPLSELVRRFEEAVK